MYLSAATNRITVTWGNYGKVGAMGRHAGLRGGAGGPPVSPSLPPLSELFRGAVLSAADDLS